MELSTIGTLMADEFFETPSFVQEPYMLLSEGGEDTRDYDSGVLIDPRTANHFGAYTEEEIYDDMTETASLGVLHDVPEQDVGPIKGSLDQQTAQDPVIERDHQTLREMGMGRLKLADMQARQNELYTQFMHTQDPRYELELGVVEQEIEQHVAANPDMFDDEGFWDQVVKNSANGLGQVRMQMYQMAVAPGGFENKLLAMQKYSQRQMQGSIYGQLIRYEDPETGMRIPHETAKQMAIAWGTPAGSLEMVGEVGQGVAAAMGISVPAAMSFVGSILTESGTEAAQTVLENSAQWMAINIEREKAGLEPLPMTQEILLEQVPESAKAGAYAAIGLAGGGQVVTQTGKVVSKGTAKLSTVTRDKLQKRKQLREEAATREAEETNKAIAQANRVEAATEKDKQTVSAQDEDGTDLPAAELRPSEIADSHSTPVSKNTGIRDGFFDDAVIADNEDAFVADVNASVDGSFDVAEVEINEGLREILPDEDQAQAIDAIMGARADSALISKAEWIENRIKELRIEGPDKNRKASVIFNEEGQAIIRAFEGADVSSIAHEIGHIFRRDLRADDLKIAEEWAGARDGVWTRAAEEKFARGFEQYLSEGRAPTQELQQVFANFARWMKEIYKAVRNSPIDVDINDDIRGVFDRLLTEGQGVKLGLEGQIQEQMELAQAKQKAKKKAPIDPVAQAEYEALVEKIYGKYAKKRMRTEAPMKLREVLEATRGKKMGPKKTFDMQMRALHRIMKDMFDRGDKVGYARAKAEGKAIIARERQRRMARERTKGVEKLFNKLFKSALKKGAMDIQDTKMMEEVKTLFDEVHGMSRKEMLQFHADLTLNAKDPADMTPAEALRNAYVDLKTRAIDAQGVADLNEFYKQIRDYVRGARYDAPFMQMLRAARDINRVSYSDVAGPGVYPDNLRSVEEADQLHKQRFREEIRDPRKWKEMFARNTLGKWWLFGWNGLMELITTHTPAEKGRSEIQRAADFHRNEERRDTEVREKTEGMTDALMDLFNITAPENPRWRDTAELNKRINKDLKKDIDIGLKSLKGKTILQNMSQVRQWYMYLQDPTLRQRLYNMGINDQVEQRIYELVDADGGRHRRFADWLLNEFQSDETYNPINEVHERLYGHSLKRRLNYVPVLSEAQMNAVQQQREEGEIINRFRLDEVMRQTAESSGRLKGRNDELYNSPMVVEGDISLYTGYLHEMAHFKHMSEQLRLVRTMFNDNNLKKLIAYEYGKNMLPYINRHFRDIQANGVNYANTIPWLDRVRSAFVGSTVGMSVGVMAKQFISMMNYWQHIPTKNMLSHTKWVASNPGQAAQIVRDLWNSDFLKNRRGGGHERDFARSLNSKQFRRFQLNPTWSNLIGLNVTLGDSGAIALGGVLLYRELRDQGMTHQEAIFEVGRLSNQTQQSRSILEQSNLQRAGSLTKWFTTYSTGPLQGVRQEALAVRGWLGGRVSRGQAIKTLMIYHVMVPAAYSLAASFISGDDEDWLKHMLLAAAIGPLGSVYSVGRGITNGVKRVLGMRYYQNVGPINDIIMDVARLGQKIVAGDWEDITVDDVTSAMQSGLVPFGIGLPVERVGRMVQNAAQGDMRGAVFGTKPKDE